MQASNVASFAHDQTRRRSRSVQGGGDCSAACGLGAAVQGGRRNGVFEGRVGDVQSFAFALLGAALAASRRRGVCANGPAVCGKRPRGVRVHDGAVAWAGLSGLRLPLGAGGGQQRREGGRLQKTFGSLRALEKEKTGSDERLRVRGRAAALSGKWLL